MVVGSAGGPTGGCRHRRSDHLYSACHRPGSASTGLQPRGDAYQCVSGMATRLDPERELLHFRRAHDRKRVRASPGNTADTSWFGRCGATYGERRWRRVSGCVSDDHGCQRCAVEAAEPRRGVHSGLLGRRDWARGNIAANGTRSCMAEHRELRAGCGFTIVVLFVVMAALAVPEDGPLHPWFGLLQRVVLAVWFPCTIVTAIRLLRVARRSSRG